VLKCFMGYPAEVLRNQSSSTANDQSTLSGRIAIDLIGGPLTFRANCRSISAKITTRKEDRRDAFVSVRPQEREGVKAIRHDRRLA
jgi:hypothetical protein